MVVVLGEFSILPGAFRYATLADPCKLLRRKAMRTWPAVENLIQML
jgi:hypothetical protein